MSTTSLRVRVALGFACLGVVSVLAACGSDEKTDSSSDSSSAADSTENAGDDGPYEIDDCAGPDPSRGADAYRQFDCDEDGATVKVIALQPASFGITEPDCPSGTDEIITVETTYSESSTSGIPSQTLCVRNLTGDHPGDPGMGGGQLKEQDCISADESIAEIPCGPGALKVLAFANSTTECPPETTDPIELQFQVGLDYSVICTIAA